MDAELQAVTWMCQTALAAVWEHLLHAFPRGDSAQKKEDCSQGVLLFLL
jgi:hypothetical protein